MDRKKIANDKCSTINTEYKICLRHSMDDHCIFSTVKFKYHIFVYVSFNIPKFKFIDVSMSLCQKLQQKLFLLPLFESKYIYLVNGWRYPQHFPVRVDQHIGLVSHFIVTISTEKKVQSLITRTPKHIHSYSFG
jgi:hypothetical protein